MTSDDRYLEVVYNEDDRPFTEYPDLLTRHLVSSLKKALRKPRRIAHG